MRHLPILDWRTLANAIVLIDGMPRIPVPRAGDSPCARLFGMGPKEFVSDVFSNCIRVYDAVSFRGVIHLSHAELEKYVHAKHRCRATEYLNILARAFIAYAADVKNVDVFALNLASRSPGHLATTLLGEFALSVEIDRLAGAKTKITPKPNEGSNTMSKLCNDSDRAAIFRVRRLASLLSYHVANRFNAEVAANRDAAGNVNWRNPTINALEWLHFETDEIEAAAEKVAEILDIVLRVERLCFPTHESEETEPASAESDITPIPH
jgi:hypothetical protein